MSLKSKKGDVTHEELGTIANEILAHLDGLNLPSVEYVMDFVNTEIVKNYFLSNPKDLRNS